MLALSSMLLLPTTAAYMAPGCAPMRAQAAARVPAAPVMDETIIEKALLGELEEEGAENVFMSEVGWASYLDKNAGSSYNMNQRPSMAEDGYFTSSILSNPAEGERQVHCRFPAIGMPPGTWRGGIRRLPSRHLGVLIGLKGSDTRRDRSSPWSAVGVWSLWGQQTSPPSAPPALPRRP